MKKCPYCAEEILDEAIKCKHCKEFLSVQVEKKKSVGKNNTKKKFKNSLVALGLLWVVLVVGYLLFLPKSKNERATYPESEKKRGTYSSSKHYSNEELAWHAVNTYGWDCPEVVSKGEMKSGGYFWITCSKPKNSKDMNTLMLRVYPREGKHPKITNKDGGYD